MKKQCEEEVYKERMRHTLSKFDDSIENLRLAVFFIVFFGGMWLLFLTIAFIKHGV